MYGSGTVFEYSHGVRFGAAFVAGLMWLLAAAAMAGGLALAWFNFDVAAIAAGTVGVLMLPWCFSLRQAKRMKHEWRVSLRRGHATLVLPENRASHYRTDLFEGEVSYQDIDAIVRRKETYTQAGIGRQTMPYWLVLKDGRRLLLGEDRRLETGPDAKMSLTARAAEAISAASGIPMTHFDTAEGRPGLLGIWARPPSWPVDA